MGWYTASIITTIKLSDGSEQDVYPVFEDFYLVEAGDRAFARSKAESIGCALEQLKDGLELNGKPAERKFMGVRKIRSLSNPSCADFDSVKPTDGTEVSHSYFEVRNELDVLNIARGKRVLLDYVDDDDSEHAF